MASTGAGPVWLVVPAHGRPEVSKLAFAGLAWMRDYLQDDGYDANICVVACDENLDIAAKYKFATLDRPNTELGRKWNDGYEHAAKAGAGYLMPCGSDDWVHPELVKAMVAHHVALGPQKANTMVCTRASCAVAPDASELVTLHIPYNGGDGIRLMPASLLKQVAYRPAADERNRAIDGSISDKLAKHGGVQYSYVAGDPLHIVDFKSDGTQITDYKRLAEAYTDELVTDVWGALGALYPANLLKAAKGMYKVRVA